MRGSRHGVTSITSHSHSVSRQESRSQDTVGGLERKTKMLRRKAKLLLQTSQHFAEKEAAGWEFFYSMLMSSEMKTCLLRMQAAIIIRCRN